MRIACLTLFILAVGCVGDQVEGPDQTTTPYSPKGTAWMEESGKILALREQTALYLNESRAAEIDERLVRARRLDSGHDVIAFADIFARSGWADVVWMATDDEAVATRWRRGELATGTTGLDSLVASLEPSQFERKYFEEQDREYFELRFARWVKMEALVEQLNEYPFVFSWMQEEVGDGPDIVLVEEDDASRFTFYFKWGDCFVGCIHSHYWEILVPHDLELPAQVVNEGGEPLPDFMN